jgi:PAS domain S-box-containing protein
VDSTDVRDQPETASRIAVQEQELRELRQRYQSLFDNALEGIFRTSVDGRWLSANATMARMLGYNSPEELMRTSHVREFYADPSERELLIQRMEADGFVVGYEHNVRRRDGSTMWVLMNAYTLRDDAGEIIGFEGMEIDITERKRSEEHRARLLAETVRAAEDERTRLATELHDGPIQRLSHLGYVLERALMQLDSGKLEKTNELVSTAHEGLTDEIRALRQTMVQLRPPVLDERGLAAALRDHAHAFAKEADVRVDVVVDLGERLEESLETIIYRIVQEALRNVVKHAHARTVRVGLSDHDGAVILTVDDDGVGFESPDQDPADGDGHFGIEGMQQRTTMAGGKWTIVSTPGGGTRIRATFPKVLR